MKLLQNITGNNAAGKLVDILMLNAGGSR